MLLELCEQLGRHAGHVGDFPPALACPIPKEVLKVVGDIPWHLE